MMDHKKKRCEQLLRDFQQTGDEGYLKAAEALCISLLDYLELRQKILTPRRRGPAYWTVGTPQRLRRMAWAIVKSEARTPNAAARQEVEEYGSGPADPKSAERRLRDEYAKVRPELEKDVRVEKSAIIQAMRAARVLNTTAIEWYETFVQRRQRRAPDQMLEVKSAENRPE